MAQQLQCPTHTAHLIQVHQPHHHYLHQWAGAATQVRGGQPPSASPRQVGKELRGLPAAVLVYLSPCTQQFEEVCLSTAARNEREQPVCSDLTEKEQQLLCTTTVFRPLCDAFS